MRLGYRDDDLGDIELGWRPHEKGAELVVTGPAFSVEGFSLGVYAPAALRQVADQLEQQAPEPRHICGDIYDDRDLRYAPLYTFTKPVKFANRQGHGTRLAIHAKAARHTRWPWQRDLYGPRTVTIHEQGERIFWRWLGCYRLEDVCAFLRFASKDGDVPCPM